MERLGLPQASEFDPPDHLDAFLDMDGVVGGELMVARVQPRFHTTRQLSNAVLFMTSLKCLFASFKHLQCLRSYFRVFN